MRKHSSFWMVCVMLALMVSACGGQPTPAAGPSESGAGTAAAPAAQEAPSVVRVGWAGSPDTLNPAAALLSESFVIYELAYSALLDLELDGEYSPDLAESWTHSEDGLVWTFKLVPNTKFHDGTPLTAKDVVFSFNFYKDHEDFPYMTGYTTAFESVEAPDDTTVVLTLNEAIPNLFSQIVFLYILPEHIWKDHTEGAAATEFENLELIGSGPFKLKQYAQGEFVHLEANRDFYRTGPKVDEVVFQTFSNLDALVQAIKTGQVDMITEMPNTAVATLRNAENVTVVTGAPLAPDVTDIILNQAGGDNCPTDEGGVCSGHPALADRNVRLALAHATNKQELIDIILLGLGTPGLTLIPDSLGNWYNGKIADYPFDTAKANQILEDAGYKDSNGDGVREMPDGSRDLTFRLNWPSDSTVAPRLAELLGKTWGQIGVKLEMQALDPDALTSICCPAFDYDILIWGWGSDPDPSFLLSVMLTDQIPTGMSETGYSSPEFDDLFIQQSKELDPAKRQEIVWKMQEILHQDVVYIVPFYSKAVQAYRSDRFKGWIVDQPKLALDDVTSLMMVEPVR